MSRLLEFAILCKMIYNVAVSNFGCRFSYLNKILFKGETSMKKTSTEMKIDRVSNERDCVLIEASKLSLTDDFMSHEPRTVEEKEFKATLTGVIENGIEDFYRPAMDPSFSDKDKIHYVVGEKPTVGKSYNWWKETIKDSKWCFGTKAQYVAFLGVLIKMLVAKGWKVAEAWNAVCNDSKNLGHYSNSDNAKYQFESTGSREVCGFFDLANTYKILAEDEEAGGFWLAGGFFDDDSGNDPLAGLWLYVNFFNYNHNFGVAWLVLKQ